MCTFQDGKQFFICNMGEPHGKTLLQNTWKKIKVQQNLIVKTLAHAPFLRTKVAPICHLLDFLTLNNTFKLEVLKFVFNFRKKKIPKCLGIFFFLKLILIFFFFLNFLLIFNV